MYCRLYPILRHNGLESTHTHCIISTLTSVVHGLSVHASPVLLLLLHHRSSVHGVPPSSVLLHWIPTHVVVGRRRQAIVLLAIPIGRRTLVTLLRSLKMVRTLVTLLRRSLGMRRRPSTGTDGLRCINRN